MVWSSPSPYLSSASSSEWSWSTALSGLRSSVSDTNSPLPRDPAEPPREEPRPLPPGLPLRLAVLDEDEDLFFFPILHKVLIESESKSRGPLIHDLVLLIPMSRGVHSIPDSSWPMCPLDDLESDFVSKFRRFNWLDDVQEYNSKFLWLEDLGKHNPDFTPYAKSHNSLTRSSILPPPAFSNIRASISISTAGSFLIFLVNSVSSNCSTQSSQRYSLCRVP